MSWDEAGFTGDAGYGSADTSYDYWGAGADAIDFYLPTIVESFNGISDTVDFGDFGKTEAELSPSGATGGAPADGTKGGIMDGIRRWMGFGDDAKSRAAFGTGAMTVGAGLIAGAASGYQKGKQLEIEKKQAEDRRELMKSQTALNEAKTNQKGLDKLQFNTPPPPNGLIAANMLDVTKRYPR